MNEAEKKYIWTPDIKEWSNIDIETYKFCFDQAQKRLVVLIEDSEKITNKAYTLVGIIIPLLSICIGTIIKYIQGETFGFGIVVSIAGLTAFTVSLCFLYKLITTRVQYPANSEPKEIFITSQLEFEFNKAEHAFKSMLYNEMQRVQFKINYNTSLNQERIKSFKFCLLTILITSVILIATTLIFAIL